MIFSRVRDIPLRFISLNVIFSHLLVGIIHFLFKHYEGLTIYRFPIFRPPKFFTAELVEMKISIFGFFLDAVGYVLESCLYRRLRNAYVFALIDGEPFRTI